MLVLIAIIMTVIPAAIILYPLIRRIGSTELLKDESSLTAELNRRWESVVAGLRTAELEMSIGNLSEEDYHWIKNTYAKETAQIMEAMELQDEEEEELMKSLELEIKKVKIESVDGKLSGDKS
ncbi:MAG: hypothetical protein DK302_001549 [Chloroflexi bacterium]|jgi:hypothetical protein|nr:MAG: hypothetical protein DK302_001549 [Chloroflexota bacterium]